MIWLNPAALFALALIAAPLLIHLLVQRRAERVPFPTLRFLRPTRLAAIRRHLLEDVPLLLVRAAILGAASAALAGPLLVTAARRQAWDRRVVRAVVVAEGARSLAEAPEARRREPSDSIVVHATRAFETSADLSDGVRRAVAWLESAPPARRELVIVSPLAIGSITSADIAAIPADVGIRFERSGALPPSRTVPLGRIVTPNGEIDREVTLAGPWTSVRDTAAASSSATAWPIEVVAQPDTRSTVDAAIAAVRAQRVPSPASPRRARLVLLPSTVIDASPVRTPWIADAIARLARDTDLQTAASRLPRGIADASFTRSPWQAVAVAADGGPAVVAAAAADRLLVASGAPASDLATPLLMRAIAYALAPVQEVRRAEVVPIPDTVLGGWAREPSAHAARRVRSVDEDDRRWLWIAVLALLALETWMRQGRERSARAAADESAAGVGGTARVA